MKLIKNGNKLITLLTLLISLISNSLSLTNTKYEQIQDKKENNQNSFSQIKQKTHKKLFHYKSIFYI